MEPLTLIVSLAVGLGAAAAAKAGMDKLLSKSAIFAQANELLKDTLRKHEPAIRAALVEKFNPIAVDLLLATTNKVALSRESIDHLKDEDPKLFVAFLEIIERYEPKLQQAVDAIENEIEKQG